MFFCIQTLASLSRLLHELNQHNDIKQTENKVVQANTKTHKMQYSAEQFRLSFLAYMSVQLSSPAVKAVTTAGRPGSSPAVPLSFCSSHPVQSSVSGTPPPAAPSCASRRNTSSSTCHDLQQSTS